MAQTTNWWDQNIGDWINDRISAWGDDTNQNYYSALNAAQRQLAARQEVIDSYNLPPGYEVNMQQRSWYGSETNISIRSPTTQELMGEQNQDFSSQQQQAAVNEALASHVPESTQEAAERMTRHEIHATEMEEQQQYEHMQEQAKQQEQAHDLER